MEPVTNCRSCGAQIIWITTRRGKKMPVDAKPVWYIERPDGRSVLFTLGGKSLRGDVQRDGKYADGAAYVAHFGSCPKYVKPAADNSWRAAEAQRVAEQVDKARAEQEAREAKQAAERRERLEREAAEAAQITIFDIL